MNLKGYKSTQNSRISDDIDEQNSVDSEVALLQDLYSEYTDDLEEMRSNYANGREDTATVEDWEQAYRALIDEIRGLDIENPQEVYDTLVDWNWHRLTWCMCLAGKLGQGELNEAVKWLGKYAYDDKSYLALKNIANSDFGGSRVGDSRRIQDRISRQLEDNIEKWVLEELDDDKKILFDTRYGVVDFYDFDAQDILNGGTSLSKTVDNKVLENADKLEYGDFIGYQIFFDDYTEGEFHVFVHCDLVSDTVYDKHFSTSKDQTLFEKRVPNDEVSIEKVIKEAVDVINSVQLGTIDYSKITTKEEQEEYDEDDEYVREQYNNYVNNVMLKDDPDMQGEWF